ncbi:MAG: TIGR03560 family F420-dependent LLM class oxidoreductase [Actinomycetota bacterium]
MTGIEESAIPAPAVVILIGSSGAGKSTWAERYFRSGEVLSADAFRALTGSGSDDQAAGTEAFELLDRLLAIRAGKGLTTVIDTTGLDSARRARYRAAAAAAGLPAVAVVFDTDPALCHERNAERDHSIPKTVLDRQLREFRKTRDGLAEEGFDLVVVDPGPPRRVPAGLTPAPTSDVEAPSGAAAGGSLAFDLVVSTFGFDGDLAPTLIDIALAAEAAGFRSLWVMDHFRQIPQLGRAWDPMPEAYTTLAFLAARTSTLRLGTLVTGVEHRNVGLLAKIIATLDVLSGGRAECGLGAGWFDAEQAAYGYPVNADRVRLDTLEEALQALPVLWGPGSKSFTGSIVSIPEATLYPRPIQDPIPILVGGGGEKRTLRLAARYAAACNVMGPRDVIARKIDVVRAHCRDVDRDPAELAITVLDPLVHAGTGAELDALIDRLRPRNRSADAFAAATNAATTIDHVARFRALSALGVDRICVALTGNDGPDRVEHFADVIQEFH